jgi:hypothetical protein
MSGATTSKDPNEAADYLSQSMENNQEGVGEIHPYYID